MSDSNFLRCLLSLLDKNPPWFTYPETHVRLSLLSLKHVQLRSTALKLSQSRSEVLTGHGKASYVDYILPVFFSRCHFISTMTTDFLSYQLQQVHDGAVGSLPRALVITKLFESEYGCSIAYALRVPPWPVEYSFSDPDETFTQTLPWVIGELSDWMSRLPRKILLHSLR